MFKFGIFVLFASFLSMALDKNFFAGYAVAFVLMYALPFGVRKTLAARKGKALAIQEQSRKTAEEAAEEAIHQTALRRERERLEMQVQVRLGELFGTLEAQHRTDAAKMQQLADMKAEFAKKQQADTAELLRRLEAMKGVS